MTEYSEYKDSGQQWLGKVPSHWAIAKISTIFDENSKQNFEHEYSKQLQFKFGTIIPKKLSYDSEDSDWSIIEKYVIVKPNDIVINGLNLNYDLLSLRVGLVKEEGIITSAYILLRPKEGNNPSYLNYAFKGWDSRKLFHGMGTGVRLTLSWKELKNYYIPIPPKEEQEAIVAYLDKVTDDIDKAITAKQRIIASLEERRKIIITHAVTRGINPDAPLKDSGIDWLGKIPAHWEIIKLGAMGSTQNGVSNDSAYFGNGYPFVSYSDVYKNFALPSTVAGLANSTPTEQKNYSVQSGDVFFTRTSETAEEIGFSSVCLETIPKAVFAGFLIRFRPKHNILNPLFSKYYFRASVHRNYFVKEMNLVIRASLSQKLLRGLPILIPPMNEQTQISEYLEDKVGKLDNLIKITNKEIELLRERKNIIINETVTGKVKVI